MVKAYGLPDARLVAFIALIAESAEVKRVVMAAHATLLWRAIVFVVYVALDTIHFEVALVQRPCSAKAMDAFDALRSHALGTLGLVAFQTGLYPLAISHDLHALRLVGEVVVVNVLVFMTAHAQLAIVRRLTNV